jgi:hypothetical protein
MGCIAEFGNIRYIGYRTKVQSSKNVLRKLSTLAECVCIDCSFSFEI